MDDVVVDDDQSDANTAKVLVAIDGSFAAAVCLANNFLFTIVVVAIVILCRPPIIIIVIIVIIILQYYCFSCLIIAIVCENKSTSITVRYLHV